MYGKGDCSEWNFCSEHGTCVDGLCECDTQWTGANCDVFVECRYWDKTYQTWSTEGCISSPPPTGRPDGFLYCNCTHLTEFGGIEIPLSAEDLLAQFTNIEFALFTLDDLANVLTNFDPMANPQVFTLLMIITVLDVFMMCCNKFRYHRRGIRRGRAAAMRRQELRKKAMRQRKKEEPPDSALALRRERKAENAGPAVRREAERRSHERGKLPAIQDRVFLDLLDADMCRPSEALASASALRKPRRRPEKPPPEAASPIKDPLAELLQGLGEGLPPVESEGGAIVPWAELLQQRIRSGGEQLAAGSPSMPCKMVQQRLPCRASSLMGSSCTSLALAGPSTPLAQNRIPRRPADAPALIGERRTNFVSERIPNVSARLSGMMLPATPSRLDALRHTPTGEHQAYAISPYRMSQGSQSAPRGSSTVVSLATASRLARLSATPTVASDGTVSSRLTMRRVPSHKGLVLPAPQASEQLPGGLAAGQSAAEAAPPASSAILRLRPSVSTPTLPQPALSTPQLADPKDVPSVPPSPPHTPHDGAPSICAAPMLERTPSDEKLGSMLNAVTTALGESTGHAANAGAGGAAEGAGSLPPQPQGRASLQSARLYLQPPQQPTTQPEAPPPPATASGVPPVVRMQSSRLRLLPPPPPSRSAAAGEAPYAASIASMEAGGVEDEDASAMDAVSSNAEAGHRPSDADADACSQPPPSFPSLTCTRLRLLHAPSTALIPASEKMVQGADAATLRSLTASLAGPSQLPAAGGEGAGSPALSLGRRRVKTLLSAAVAKENALQTLSGAKGDGAGAKFAAAAVLARSKQKMNGAAGALASKMDEKRKAAIVQLKSTGTGAVAVVTSKKAAKGFFFGICGRVKRFMYNFWTTARSEHTLANAIAPLEEDILGDSLTDEQIIHIFWCTVLAELAMINLLSLNGNDAAFDPVNIIITGFMTAMACSVVAKLQKESFKFFNKKRRRQSLYDKLKKQMRQRRRNRRNKARVLQVGPDAAVSARKSTSVLSYLNPRTLRSELKASRQRARWQERQSFLKPLERTFMPAKVERMRIEAERQAQNARKIQALARRRTARKELLRRRKEAGYDQAAVKMQAAARRRAARDQIVQRREHRENTLAATQLQAAQRRHVARAAARERAAERAASRQSSRQSTAEPGARRAGGVLSGPSPPPSPPSAMAEGQTVTAQPAALRTNRFLQRLAAAEPAVAPTDSAATNASPAVEFAASVAAPAPSEPPAPAVPGPTSVAQSSAGAPIPALRGNGNRFLQRLAASAPAPAHTEAAAAPATNGEAALASGDATPAALRKNRFLQRLAAGSAASEDSSAPAPAAACNNKLLMKTFGGGGGAAPGAKSGGAEGEAAAFSSNKFLARFAASIKEDEGAGGDGAQVGKRNGKKLWQKARAVKMTSRAKISAEEAERIRRSKLVPFTRKYILLRWTIGWILNCVLFAMLWIINLTYGVMFGPAEFQVILYAWAAALFQTFIIVEPSEVLALVLMPSIADNPCIVKCRTQLKDLGFI